MEASEPKTLKEAIIYFADVKVATQFLARFRWEAGKATCPRCESQETSFLGTRLIWKCKGCKKQFSVKTGTVLENSPMGLDKWLPAIWMVCGCKNGISSYEMARDLGISQKSAWFMLHRIRKALASGTLNRKLSGEVEADESFFGGRVPLMNNRAKTRAILKYGRISTSGTEGKAIVMGLLERHTGEARVRVVAKRKRGHLTPFIEQNVEDGSNLYTDDLASYRKMFAQYKHEFINHAEAYVRENVHTNGLENFWALFKRAIKGTYVSVEPFHLQAYADEQCFRFNNRKVEDADRFRSALFQIAGRRLTWKELIGEDQRDAPVSWGLDKDAGSDPGPNSWKSSELLRPYPWETGGE